jgi:hypothetical protein
MSPCISSLRAILIGCLAVFVVAAESVIPVSGSAASAQESTRPESIRPESDQPASRIRRVFVPEDELDRFLTDGQWKPIERTRFEALSKAATRRSDRSTGRWIERAEYSATFGNGMLRDGQLSAEVRNSTNKPGLLSLDSLGLALSDLAWNNGPAVWGATKSDSTAIRVETAKAQLQGRWSLTGRRLPRGVEFDVELATATVSRLILKIPATHVPHCSQGVSVGPLPSETPQWKTWRIELGSQTRCRLTISEGKPRVSATPTVLTESDVTCVVRADGFHFRHEHRFEVLGNSVDRLTFAVPNDIEIFTVAYGTDETRLKWTTTAMNGTRRLHVQLPDPVLGRGRSIIIRGTAPSSMSTNWTVPEVRLQSVGGKSSRAYESVFLTGALHLTIALPLETRGSTGAGYRQTDSVSDMVDGDTLHFHRFRDSARLILSISSPGLTLAVQSATRVVITGEQQTMVSDVKWQARSGATFQVQLGLPSSWQMTDVRTTDEDSPRGVTTWNMKRSRNGLQTLTIEFAESLRPNVPRSVRLFATRTTTPRQKSIEIPVPTPLNCEQVESYLAIVIPKDIQASLAPSATLSVVESSTLPEPIRRRLFNDSPDVGPNSSTIFLHSTALRPVGRLRVDSPTNQHEATVWSRTSCSESTLEETISIRLNPNDEALERFLVYLTATGPAPRWTLPHTPDDNLTATKLPTDRHQEWDLPTGGELWEIGLPQSTNTEFDVVLQRARPTSSSKFATLAIVLDVKTFHGIVEWSETDDTTTGPSTTGLDTVASQDALRIQPNTIALLPVLGQYWSYHDHDASLRLGQHGNGHEHPAKVASLRLQSVMGKPRVDGEDLHIATYRIPATSPGNIFRLELARPDMPLTVRVAGQPTSFVRRHREVSITLPETRPIEVEVRYRSPIKSVRLITRRSIDLPKASHAIVAFDWHIALPPSLQIEDEPESVVLDKPLPVIGWTERFFGPLGRASAAQVFNPFDRNSWPDRSGQETLQTPSPRNSSQDAFAPQSWHIVHATSTNQPNHLTINLRDTQRTNVVSWAVLATCLMTGLTLRVLRIPARGRVVGISLGVGLVLAAVSSPAHTMIAGAGLVGTLIATLTPRRALIRPVKVPATRNSIALGSTASFRHPSSLAMILAAVMLAATSNADEVDPVDSARPATSTSAKPFNSERSVIIPIGTDDKPSSKNSLVYVREALLQELQDASRQVSIAPQYLIKSAEYTAQIDVKRFVTLEARFSVAVLSVPVLNDTKTTQIVLPITGANLAGRNACTVNGQPHDVFRTADGHYQLELAHSARRKPAAQETKSPIEWFDVLLQLHPPTNSVPGGGRFSLGIPQVLASRLTVNAAEQGTIVAVPETRGLMTVDQTKRKTTAQLGQVDHLDVSWTTATDTADAATALDAQISCFIDVNPTWQQVRYRVKFQVVRGPIDYISWRVPQGLHFREIRGEELRNEAVFVSPTPEGGSQVVVEFESSRVDDFELEAVFLSSPNSPSQQIQLPVVNPFGSQEGTTVRVTSHQLGVSAPAEFLLEPETKGWPTAVKSISTEAFTNGDTTATADRPLYAYDVLEPTSLPFRLSSLEPQRKVSIEQFGRVTDGELLWRMTAQVETSTAAAFQHELIIDPKLQIREVSVREDEAERLVRTSRVGNRLILFLNGKTSGTQTIELTGSMPLAYQFPQVLPTVRVADADITQSLVSLYHDNEVILDLLDREQIQKQDTEAETPEDFTDATRLGTFRLVNPEQSPRVRKSRRRDRVHVESFTMLERVEQSWKATTHLRIFSDDVDQLTNRIRLQIPAEFAATARIETSGSIGRRITTPDGTVGVIISFRNSDEAEREATITSVLEELPQQGRWKLNAIAVVPSTDQQHFLLVPPALNFAPADATTTQTAFAKLPEWIAETAVDRGMTRTRPLFLTQKKFWRLTRRATADTTRSSAVSLLATRLWLTHGQQETGRTGLRVRPSADGLVVFTWPERIDIEAVFVDGTAVACPSPSAGQLRLDIDDIDATRTVVLHWSRRRKTDLPWFGQFTEPLPYPRNLPVTRALLVISTPKGMWFSPDSDTLSAIPTDNTTPLSNVLAIDPQGRQVEFFEQMPVSSGPFELNANLLEFEPWLWWVLACMAMPFVIIIAYRIVRLEAGEWLHRHHAIAWLLLGMLWWFCLTPSVLGLLGVAASIVVFLRRNHQPTMTITST